MQLRLDDIRRAYEAQDPELVELVEQLVNQSDEPPEEPIREGVKTFDDFIAETRGYGFKRKSLEEQMHYRIEQLKLLQAPDAEVPLPDRLRSHEILFALWNDDSLFARQCLLKLIARLPLIYGPWKALKRIFKEAETQNDTEVLGALAARFDMEFSTPGMRQITGGTLAYLVRRGWRYLRRLAVRLPAFYADAAADFLSGYTDSTNWNGTWVANHIFYHETKEYGRTRFFYSSYYSSPDNLTKDRAFADLWKRTPRPLFSLLERAQSEKVRDFATEALKTDFRATLREVEASWVVRLIHVESRSIHDFVLWILENVPRFEKAAFRTLGLHDAVLRLFDSPSHEARAWAAEYARTHARDLPVDELIRLANNDSEKVRQLAVDLLKTLDPRKDVGLEAWGRLLETKHGFKLASEVIPNHYGPSELTPAWFQDRLFTSNRSAFHFIKELLNRVYPTQQLGAGFFCELIDRIDDPEAGEVRWVSVSALSELEKFNLDALDKGFLKRLLLHPTTQQRTLQWVHDGRLKAQSIGSDFLKVVAYHPDFDADPWIAELRQSDRRWTRSITYTEWLADRVLGWLGDVRRFSPVEIGFDWLMKLVKRSELRYHDFAVETMIKAFAPADFAPKVDSTATATTTDAAVDLHGASFCFTGKMATMKRDDAEQQVKTANGTVYSSVSGTLHYLVVGDEGSPLYGQGKKGTKQVKAEDLNSRGGNIKIISETAFLKMLAGQPQQYSEDATLAGCQRLWQMATAAGKENAPLAQFARKYIRMHHPDIALEKTGQAVDPGAEIPQSFLTWKRVKPLLADARKPERDFALDLAHWEFARWNPSPKELVQLCESHHGDVRGFVMKALLADDEPEHRRYHIDPEKLNPEAVYSFCESHDEETRTLGMELIRRYPRFQLPEELFRLTESPDRKVRGFVIRALWSLYRDRGVTRDWKPKLPPQPTIGKKAQKKAEEAARNIGAGAPKRPDRLPADELSLHDFLRRILFEIPPGRMEGHKPEPREGITISLKHLPARKAKLYLIEALRDIAIDDQVLATGILPLLTEFMQSRGQSEQAACLVAVTRITSKYPLLQQPLTAS